METTRFAPVAPPLTVNCSDTVFSGLSRPPLNACWRSTHVERLPRYPTGRR